MHYLTDGKSTLDLTQGELVQATTDELHEYLFGACAEIADLKAKLKEGDEQHAKTTTFAADLAAKLDEEQGNLRVARQLCEELRRQKAKAEEDLRVLKEQQAKVIPFSDAERRGQYPDGFKDHKRIECSDPATCPKHKAPEIEPERSRQSDGNHGHGW